MLDHQLGELQNLRQRLQTDRRLPVPEALEIVRQAAAALDHAHHHSLIHRDIKPENVLLHEGEAMVSDFGIALAADAAPGDRLTETGLLVGLRAGVDDDRPHPHRGRRGAGRGRHAA